MNLLQELYDAYAHSPETERVLFDTKKKILEYVESEIPNNQQKIFLEYVEPIMKFREQYYFKAGFNAAKKLLLK